jgi:hypothetical protein
MTDEPGARESAESVHHREHSLSAIALAKVEGRGEKRLPGRSLPAGRQAGRQAGRLAHRSPR